MAADAGPPDSREAPRYRGFPDYDTFADWVTPRAEAFSVALYELLCKRAASWNAIDVRVESEAEHVDGEVTFSSGPDVGFTIDLEWCQVRYCELVGAADERWLEEFVDGLDGALGDDVGVDAAAVLVVDGLIEARRSIQQPTRDDRTSG